MITGLREACGFEYTSKLQRMFADIQLAIEINESFRNYLSDRNNSLGVEFNILVLTSGSWPLSGPSTNFLTPKILVEPMELFTQFYEIQHHGRKLNWLHHLSKSDLKMSIGTKRYEIQTTTYQMAILYLFNDENEYKLIDIQTSTNLSDNELKDTLKSLMYFKLLRPKDPQKTNFEHDNDVFVFNHKFVSKRKKFKLTATLQSEIEQQSQQTKKLIEDDRKLFLQATIVRIMKSRKILRHNLLINEVIEQSKSRFHPSIPIIKKCIEHLIEKEYLERKENDEYSYIA